MDKETLQAIQQMFVAEREHINEMFAAERVHTKEMMHEMLAAERVHTKEMIQEEVAPIKVTLRELKEDMQEVKGSLSSIIDWIDEAEHTVEIKFPVKRRTS